MAKKRFLGCQYPLVKSARGIMAQKSGVDQIKADLLQLLLTNPGERVMMPEFGVPLRTLLFEPNDPQLELAARVMITEALQKWEPRIELEAVQVSSTFPYDELNEDDTGEERDAILSIRILFFDPEQINELQELKLQVPLAGA